MWPAQTTSDSFAISDGWITNGPSASQLVLPLRSTPMNAVSSSSTSETENAG